MVRIDFNRLRFLVIDDNAHMRRILRTLLHGFGAREVYEAEDGAAGLEAFTHYIPDIVITDWAMPIFDGLELMQMIRQPGANANPYVAIIMLTGHSEKKRVMAARDAGVTEFLAKPISAKALYQRIINVVANPRPFIKTKTYFGPDRRRNTNSNYIGPERRKGGKADIIRQSVARKGTRPGLTKAAGMSRSKDKPSVVNHGDHEVIVPENRLRGAVSGESQEDSSEDPIARAEKALAALSPEFDAWMDSECERLDGARREIVDSGFTDANKEALFRAAHDIKGEAATFGYPAVASAAESLCRLIEHAPDPSRIPRRAHRPARRCCARDLPRIWTFRRAEACHRIDEAAAGGCRRFPDQGKPGPPRRAQAAQRSVDRS